MESTIKVCARLREGYGKEGDTVNRDTVERGYGKYRLEGNSKRNLVR